MTLADRAEARAVNAMARIVTALRAILPQILACDCPAAPLPSPPDCDPPAFRSLSLLPYARDCRGTALNQYATTVVGSCEVRETSGAVNPRASKQWPGGAW